MKSVAAFLLVLTAAVPALAQDQDKESLKRDLLKEVEKRLKSEDERLLKDIEKVIVVDRDPKVQDIMRMELGRQGFEVRVATTEREVAFLCDEYQPDVICVHLGATTREKEPVRPSLEKARTAHKTYLVLYHNYAQHVATTPEMTAQIKAVNADVVVQTDRGVTPLVDAVRSRFGLRTTVTGRKPLA